MRNALARAILFCMFALLPVYAAPCPGIVILQDAFTAANPSLDVNPYAQSKIAVQGGKAEMTLIQPGYVRAEEYWGKQFGDMNVCVTVTTPATDKAEGQSAGIIFWAPDYNSYYTFEVNPGTGQYMVGQKQATGWTFPVGLTASPAIAQGMGKSNTLRVQTRGNTATLFINDQQVGTVTGTPPAGGGQVGFTGESQSTASGPDTWDFTSFSASAAQTASAPAGSCPGTAVFQDAFPTPDPLLNIQTSAQSQVTTLGGKGEVILAQANYGQMAEYGGNQFGDANVCATFATLPTDKSENQMAGLIFWAVDYNNLYIFMINPSSGQFALSQKSGGNWSFTSTSAPNPAVMQGMGKTNTLRVLTKGNTASLYVNNQLVDSIVATPPAGGGVMGFYAQTDSTYTTKETWQIGNFTVTVP
jgi:hypothetical protein